MNPKHQVGENVRRARLQAGLSQEDLAAAAGVDRTYVSGIERGLRNPTVLVLNDIAAALKVDVAVLVAGIGGAPKRR